MVPLLEPNVPPPLLRSYGQAGFFSSHAGGASAFSDAIVWGALAGQGSCDLHRAHSYLTCIEACELREYRVSVALVSLLR